MKKNVTVVVAVSGEYDLPTFMVYMIVVVYQQFIQYTAYLCFNLQRVLT